MIMSIMFCLNMLSSDSSNLHFDKRPLNINHKDMIFFNSVYSQMVFQISILGKDIWTLITRKSSSVSINWKGERMT